MFIAGDWMWHFLPVMLMLGMVALNHFIMHQRAERRYALEASRLTSALLAELRALLKLYLTNLELIETKANYLLSTRSSAVIYKGNLGRFTSLFEPPLIEGLVTWFAENELLEARLAAQANSKGGIAYAVTPETQIEEFRQMFATGADALRTACIALEQRGEPQSDGAVMYRGSAIGVLGQVAAALLAPPARRSGA
jgi:hypothetical protein